MLRFGRGFGGRDGCVWSVIMIGRGFLRGRSIGWMRNSIGGIRGFWNDWVGGFWDGWGVGILEWLGGGDFGRRDALLRLTHPTLDVLDVLDVLGLWVEPLGDVLVDLL